MTIAEGFGLVAHRSATVGGAASWCDLVRQAREAQRWDSVRPLILRMSARMKARAFHSHLNGWEHISAHKQSILAEIEDAIGAVDVAPCPAKASKVNTRGEVHYRADELNRMFRAELVSRGWRGASPYNRTILVKDRIAIEAQFGKHASVAYDLFAKHMAFFIGDLIDVGIEILPMKELQAEMSSGVAYYEGELYNLLRQGRGTPAVPLIIVGVAV